MKRINKVAVLGAGTMGARIAAHFANAGVPSYLLDIVPPDADGPARNKIAAAGLDAAKKSKPAAFMDLSLARFVTVGNFEDDLKKLADVDWIIEAVVENLDIKRALLRESRSHSQARNDHHHQHQRPAGGKNRGRILRRLPPLVVWHAFFQSAALHASAGTDSHAGSRSAPLIDAVSHFCDVRLGKGVVLAKDTPNFIANRIGTFSVLNVMRLMQEMDLTIEEVDTLTGQAVGWPKSATFRTIDLVGLDILGHVVGNMTANVHDERSDLRLPEFFGKMLERKMVGRQNQRRLLQERRRGGEGQEDERLALDWKTLEYHPRQKAEISRARHGEKYRGHGSAVRTLLGLDGGAPQKGRQGRSISVVRAVRPVDLLRQSHPRNFRLHR